MKITIKLIAVAFLCYAVVAMSHERSEANGIRILFGGEPEPMLAGEREYLRWRFTDATSNKPVVGLSNMFVSISFSGKTFGPFEVRPSPTEPGIYQSNHIFTLPGIVKATLTYSMPDREGEQRLESSFEVHAREQFEIP
ncbi:MAG TPA: hypothetical protein PKK10_00960 [Woeseiaceae bacterium]|nr:hypothetical protein [Woeseiaceae bacterium]